MDANPQADYATDEVRAGGGVLLSTKNKAGSINVYKLGVEKFRPLLRRNGSCKEFEDYHVQPINNVLGDESREGSNNPKMKQLLNEYQSMFHEDLPKELPPQQEVDH